LLIDPLEYDCLTLIDTSLAANGIGRGIGRSTASVTLATMAEAFAGLPFESEPHPQLVQLRYRQRKTDARPFLARANIERLSWT
jgi:hypothetical protein